jgi:hypothetical protein
MYLQNTRPRLPVFALPSYVGSAMALEIVEVWYKDLGTKFIVRAIENLINCIYNDVSYELSSSWDLMYSHKAAIELF